MHFFANIRKVVQFFHICVYRFMVFHVDGPRAKNDACKQFFFGPELRCKKLVGNQLTNLHVLSNALTLGYQLDIFDNSWKTPTVFFSVELGQLINLGHNFSPKFTFNLSWSDDIRRFGCEILLHEYEKSSPLILWRSKLLETSNDYRRKRPKLQILHFNWKKV